MKKLFIFDLFCNKKYDISKEHDLISFANPNDTNITYSNDYEKITKYAYEYVEELFIKKSIELKIDNISLNETIKRELLHVYGPITIMFAIINIVKYCNAKYDEIIIYTYNDLLKERLNDYENVTLKFEKLPLKKRLGLGCYKSLLQKVFTKDRLLENIKGKEYIVFAQHRVTYNAINKNKENYFIVLNNNNTERVRDFLDMLNEKNLAYGYYEGLRNKSIITNIVISYVNNFRELEIESNYLKYLFKNLLLKALIDYFRLTEIIEITRLKKILISREYDGFSDLLCQLSYKYSFKVENFQHGGVYIGNMSFNKFYVFGQYFKDFYIQNTNSEKNQFEFKKRAFRKYDLCQNRTFIEGIDDIKKNYVVVSVFGQYICTGMPYSLKKEFAIFLNNLLKTNSNLFLLIKDHPDSTDDIFKENITNCRVNISKNDYNLASYFKYSELSISVYSTALIESVFNNIPVLCYNKKELINNSLISKIFKEYTMFNVKDYNRLFKKKNDLLREQKEKIKYYYNY